jgi:tRNA-dihydrouridine synthase A
MLDWTDRHWRRFARTLTRNTWLYSEMVVCAALLHTRDRERFLGFDPLEHPVALQLGGSNPGDMARCAELGAARGYDEININAGCPSDKVQDGKFGACLMAEPELVAQCVREMSRAVSVPITVKTRIGIDHQDSPEFLRRFVGEVAEAGCRTVIIHARKAWLQGLSPRQNREKPPLNYERAHWIKQEFPELEILINGGFLDLQVAHAQLDHVDGVMVGRAAYENPWILREADRLFYGDTSLAELVRPGDALRAYIPYVEEELARGSQLRWMTQHLLGLFHGCHGAKSWRRVLTEEGRGPQAGIEVVWRALEEVEREFPDELGAATVGSAGTTNTTDPADSKGFQESPIPEIGG